MPGDFEHVDLEDAIVREAILEAHERRCIVCNRALIDGIQIDHWIPEALAKNDPATFAALCSRLGFPNLNAFGLENVAPVHGLCNQRKGGNLFTDEVLALGLKRIAQRIPDVRRLLERWRSDQSITKAAAILQAALREGRITQAEADVRMGAIIPTRTPQFEVRHIQSIQRELERLGYPQTAISVAAEAVRLYGANLGNALWTVPFTFNGDPSWEAWVQRASGTLLITWVGPKKARPH